MLEKLFEYNYANSDDNFKATVDEYMGQLNADAEPGDFVHIKPEELEDVRQFAQQFTGVGALMRMHEELLYQQNMALRWFHMNRVHERSAKMWRWTAFGVVAGQLLSTGFRIYAKHHGA